MTAKKPYSIPVSEYTTPCPVTVLLDSSVDKIKTILETENIRHLPVIDNDKPVGIISERDISLLVKHTNCDNLTAQDIMTPGPYLISPEVALEDAAFDLSKYKIGSALVVDSEGKLSGIFTSTDALNALVEVMRGDIEE